MKAAYISQFGPDQKLEEGELGRPEAGKKEVVIKVHATSVNPVNWKIQKGLAKIKPGIKIPVKPFVPGTDISGEIVEIGKGVNSFKVGDEIFAMIPGISGAYAEYVVIKAKSLVAKPSNMTFEEAAGVPLAGLTSWQALVDVGGLQAGKKVLIIGASGGLGTYGVQIAKASGAEVAGVCSTKNVELVKSLGADHVVDYKKENFKEVLKDFDIIYDTVGEEDLASCKSVLSSEGVFVTAVPGVRGVIDLLSSHLTFWQSKRARMVMLHPKAKDLKKIANLIEAGKVKTVIHQTFPLADAEKAHLVSQEGRTVGKLILKTTKK